MVSSLVEDEEYELLPRHEIEALKKEIERLKKHPFGETKEGETLLEAINNLNDNIKRLIDIFTKTSADLKKNYGDTSPLEDIKEIKNQNEQIAQGIVAVADMMKELKEAVKPQPISPGPKIPTPLSEAQTNQPRAQTRVPVSEPRGPESPMPLRTTPPPNQPLNSLPDTTPGPLPDTKPINQPFAPPPVKELFPKKKRRGLFSRK